MNKTLERQRKIRAFTLIELLVVMAIIGILAGLLTAILGKVKKGSQQSACLANMRQLGIAFRLYSQEHDDTLPQRVDTGDKWPTLLYAYTKTTKVLVAPGLQATTPNDATLLSNGPNNTSFIMNGFNDLGAYGNADFALRTVNITSPTATILLGEHIPKDGNFYMDYVEGNQKNVLDLTAYGEGSNFVFADGSARFIKKVDYNDLMWAVDKRYQIPNP